MNNDLPSTCTHFLQCIEEDLPTVKLYKYRHFLTNYQNLANKVFDKIARYALDKRLLGQYEAIHEIAKKPLEKVDLYKQLRQQMVDFTNPLRNQTQHAQSISNYEDMVNGYFKLAQYYKDLTMHQESAGYYSKLFRTQTGNKIIYKKSQYFSSWAQQLFLQNNWTELNIFIRNQIQDVKLVDTTLALIRDLKYIQMGKSEKKFFINVLNQQYPYSVTDIISNRIISYVDLGNIYSLVALAYFDRNFLKKKTVWSGKLEVLYLQNNFRGLLDRIKQFYEKQGKFHPLIDKIYNQLISKIRERVLRKYLQAFQSISLQQIELNTTFSEGQLKMLIKQNPSLPYLIDPIAQSVVYYEKSVPLYSEASNYSALIKQKYKEAVRSCLAVRRTQEIDISQLTRRTSGHHGKFGDRERQHGGRKQRFDHDDDQ